MNKPVFLVLCTASMAVWVRAAALETEVEAEAKVTSSYAWRGEVINDQPSLQSSVTLTAKDMPKGCRTSLDIWGNWDLDHDDGSDQRARVDTTLRTTIVRDEHMLRPAIVGHIYNDVYLARAQDTWELCLDYTMDVPGLPGIALYYDFVDIHGVYLAISGGHSLPLIKDHMALDLKANLGWADKNTTKAKFSLPKYAEPADRTFEPDEAAFLDFTLTAELPVKFSEPLTITPAVKYMHLLDNEIRDALDDAGEEVDSFGASLALTYTF